MRPSTQANDLEALEAVENAFKLQERLLPPGPAGMLSNPSKPAPIRPADNSRASKRVVLWHLDDNEPHPIGVLYPHLSQPPRLIYRRLEYLYPSIFELASNGVNITHL